MSLPNARDAYQASVERMHKQLGISNKERRTFSIARAIAGLNEPRQRGYEWEVAEQTIKSSGYRAKTNNSLVLPTGLNLIDQRRDILAATDSQGGYLVGTGNVGSSFIDMLRPELISSQIGVTFLPGLKGDVSIPKLAAAASAYWLTNEATATTESQPTFGQLPLTPKTVGAYSEFSRQLLLQSDPAADWIIANDLTKVVARAVDAAVFAGTGANGQPFGVAGTSGIGSVTAGALTYSKALEFVVAVASANALNVETCAFVTTPAIAIAALQRQRFTGTDTPVWEGNTRAGKVCGVTARSTANVATGHVLFGDWSNVVIGEWGVLEIASNPYADFKAGITGVRCMYSVDVGVRQSGAFALGTGMS